MKRESSNAGLWNKHLDKYGVGGSLFAALCCLGFPALLSLLSAIGLGFLINDAILLPLLGVFLIITIAGLEIGRRRHRRPGAIFFGIVSAAALGLFIFPLYNNILAGLSIGGLIAASILNVISQHQSQDKPAIPPG